MQYYFSNFIRKLIHKILDYREDLIFSAIAARQDSKDAKRIKHTDAFRRQKR